MSSAFWLDGSFQGEMLKPSLCQDTCSLTPRTARNVAKVASGCSRFSDLPQFKTSAIISMKVRKQNSVVCLYHTFIPCYLTGDLQPFSHHGKARLRGTACSTGLRTHHLAGGRRRNTAGFTPPALPQVLSNQR